MIRARVLGAFHLSVDDRRLEHADWQRVSAERLVKLLLVAEGHAVPREVAIETLWPEVDAGSGYNTFRKALHFARRALGAPDILLCDRDTVRLDPGRLDLDLDRLRTAFHVLGRSTRDAAEAERDAVATVLELGGRTLFPDDAYEDWLVGPREQLLSRWQVVAIDAAREAGAAGRKGEAHAILDQVLDRDPTDEAAHRLVIELYASEGRHHSARRQFELCRAALAANLDAEPSPETVEAYRRAELAARSTAAAPAPPARLVGRQRELALVEPLLDRLAAGRSAALIIRGPAGIGKTRLLDEIRELGRVAGWREFAWQAIESNHPFAFAPFVLRLGDVVTSDEVEAWGEPERSAVATILPGLGVHPHLEFADRSAFVVALVAAVAHVADGCPLFIAVDDVPWLDEASTEVLAAVASAFPDLPLLLAVTYRDEEAVPAPTAAFLDGLRRSGALELHLAPLAKRDIEPLVLAHLGGESIAPDLGAWLFDQSEGNPLFCIEVARDSAERGAIHVDNERWHTAAGGLPHEPPRAVRQLVLARIRSLDTDATRLLQTVAELGPVVGYATLAAVLPDLGRGLIAALDAALASGLLVERAGGYAFAHPLFRGAVEAESGMARRAAMHLALARALAGAKVDERLDPVSLAAACADPGPAAEHALVACELGLREAAPFAVALGFAAGIRARQLFDRAGATSFLERAIAIWSRLQPAEATRFDATSAYVNLAELHMAAGDETAADAAFRQALAAARTAQELGYAYDRFWWLRYRHGDFAAAMSLSKEALARLPAEAAAPRAVMDAHIGWCLGHGLHRIDEALEHLAHAIQVLDAHGDQAQLSETLDQYGLFLAFAGRNAEGLTALERALALALDLRDARLEMVRGHLALLLNQTGRPNDARPHAQRALEVAEQRGDWYVLAVMAWLSADIEDALGHCDEAVQLRRKELGLLARIGGNPHNEALAHAHLANLARRAGDGATEADEADRARKTAAQDLDPAYAAWIETAVTAERWSDVIARER